MSNNLHPQTTFNSSGTQITDRNRSMVHVMNHVIVPDVGLTTQENDRDSGTESDAENAEIMALVDGQYSCSGQFSCSTNIVVSIAQ